MPQLDVSNRQSTLNLHTFESAVIIGVGGIGAWMALDCALCSCFKKIIMFDPDTIEDTNLNRTPYRIKDIGIHKVDALIDLIFERRLNVEVYPIADLFSMNHKVFDTLRSYNNNVVFDCRDNLYHDINYNRFSKVWKLGYDGLSLTIDGNPEATNLFGDANNYSVTPSFLCPSQLIANIVLCHTVVKKVFTTVNNGEYGNTINDLDQSCLFNKKFTFDSSNILEDLFLYNKIKEKVANVAERRAIEEIEKQQREFEESQISKCENEQLTEDATLCLQSV